MLQPHETNLPESAGAASGVLSDQIATYPPEDQHLATLPQPPLSFAERTWPIIREIIETLLLAVVIWVLVNATTARYVVEGPSMENTLFRGYRLIVSRLAYRFGAEPQRGDIIVFYSPQTDEILVKRVIGLPGETLRLGANGEVYINDQLLQEPYTSSISFLTGPGQWKIPDDQYFVMGDNRARSSDSRRWGLISREEIIGRAWLIYWPIQEIKPLTHHREYSLDGATP